MIIISEQKQGEVTGPYDPSKPADVGHFLLAIKPDLFMDMSEFKARLQYLYDRVAGSDKMHGVERIYFPGELEQICAKVGFAASRWPG
jgi:LDH2 family malate/lactate/ureidoglycolate dehydrogenase